MRAGQKPDSAAAQRNLAVAVQANGHGAGAPIESDPLYGVGDLLGAARENRSALISVIASYVDVVGY